MIKRLNYKFLLIAIITIFFGCTPPLNKDLSIKNSETPQLTVIIVIDQFAYHYTPKLKKHFKYGFKNLLENGVFFTNAQHPHAAPSTPTGHAALSTGTLAKDHGFVASHWFDEAGKKIECDDDSEYPVFSQNGTYSYGRSYKNLMVDTLSDKFVSASTKTLDCKAIAISYKTIAAIPMAGRLGKAIWFEEENGFFTTSKAYFDQIPKWVVDFNQEKQIYNIKETSWELMYPEDDPAYNFKYIKDYSFAGHKFSLIKEKQKIEPGKEDAFDIFVKTPISNQILLDLGKRCIDEYLNENSKLLLWISLSQLDRIGHFYGPDSIEVIDSIYHLDQQIGDFMEYANKKVGAKNILFALTGDHGIPPIPEVMQKEGYNGSFRIPAQPIVDKMNKFIEEKYAIKELIIGFKKDQFFFNVEKFNILPAKKQLSLLNKLKNLLSKEPGIKRVWTDYDLDKMIPTDLVEFYFKNQTYPGRNGHLNCQPQPYCVLTHYATGTSHRSPYDYDTHVPLIIYQKNNIEKKEINSLVFTTQFAPTIAKILDIPRPSASIFEILPGLDL